MPSSSSVLALNISDSLANYLLIMVDPGYGFYYNNMVNNPTGLGLGEIFKQSVADEQKALNETLTRLNMTGLELFRELAVE